MNQLEEIKTKCEQYMGYHGESVGMAEVHAVLSFIHTRVINTIAEVERLRAELKYDRGIHAVVMNEQYAELDGLPEKSMRICEAIQSLRRQLEQLKAGRELT